MSKKTNDLVDIMIKQAQEREKLRDALKAIMMNTLNREFKDDPFYKTGVLGNIKVALGDEEYERLKDLYT